jgi:ABC-type transport system involved in multi-copper enzyme maturation permease subunit
VKTIWHLSRLYALGSIRRQAHLATLFLGFILLMLPAYVNAFSLGLGAFERVAQDFGLTIIGYFGIVMAIVLGSTSVPNDRESRSLHPILARPISRAAYLVAHYLALILLLGASMFILGACLLVAITGISKTLNFNLFLGVLGSYLQACIIGAACLFFSTMASPALAGTAGTAIYLVGSLSEAFIKFFLVEDRDSQAAAFVAKTFKSIFPNLTLFQVKDSVVHQIQMPAGYYFALILYALAWIAVFLTFANLVFRKKDL